jgi:long-chain acyl-CoA synthetase
VLTVTRPENRMLAGTVGNPAGRGNSHRRTGWRGRRRSDCARAERDGRLLRQRRSHAPDPGRSLAVHGDLGRLDDEGNLYLVGRSKEIIVDTNGKNVYPDEVEEVYQDSPYIKELSVIGLPDGMGEKVACIVVPDHEYDIALSRAEVRQKIEEHFREVSTGLPYYKRVKLLHFTDEELPRTATRKVKRREVLNIMQQMEERSRTSADELPAEELTGDAAWLVEIVASVSNRTFMPAVWCARFQTSGRTTSLARAGRRSK